MAKRKKQSSNFPVSQADVQDAVASSPDPEQALVPGSGEETEASDAANAKLVERLQMFQAKLAVLRGQFVAARSAQGLDRRWSEDLAQYKGLDYPNKTNTDMMATVATGFPVSIPVTRTARSTVFVQMTRQKTNGAAARLDDVLMPTDESAFSVGPGPLPALPSFVQLPAAPPAPTGAPAGGASPAQMSPAAPGDQGQPAGAPPIGGPQPAAAAAAAATPAAPSAPAAPAAPSPQATAIVDPKTQALMDQHAEAKRRSDLMQQEIEQQFSECNFNSEYRRVIFDSALLGTGVMKGPVVVNRTRKVWSRKTDATGASPYWTLEIMKELSPASFRVDPRLFFPDPVCGERLQSGRGAFELDKKTPKQVRELALQPEYIHSQLVQVLEEGPAVGKALQNLQDQEDRDMVADDVYEHWIFWGEIDRDDLIAAGVTVPDSTLSITSACIEMINSTIVRAYLNPLEGGEIPYDMVPYERSPGSAWGVGVPFLMRAGQKVINSAWRMILDNAGVCAGPQIIVNPFMIKPADKRWEITSRKIWLAEQDVLDVSKAFQTAEFASHQADLQSILDQAEKLVEAETAGPMTSSGKDAVPETVGGMQMQKQMENVGLRRQVKQYDDSITRPHVSRYYDFNMEYNPNDDIKGAFIVNALGSQALLVREIEGQELTNMLAMATNPVFQVFVNAKKLFMKTVKRMHIDPTDVMNTDAEIKAAQDLAAQNPPQDPRVEAATIAAKTNDTRTQAMIQIAKDAEAGKQQIASQATNVALQTLALERDIETLRVSLKQGISVEQVRAQLAAVAMKERGTTDRQAMQHAADERAQGADHVADQTLAMAQQTSDQNQQTADQASSAAEQQASHAHEASMQTSDQAHQAATADVSQDHQADMQGDAQDHATDLQDSAQTHEAAMPTPTAPAK